MSMPQLPFMSSFGEMVRRYRQVRGLSIAQVAEGADVPASTIAAIEGEERLPLPSDVIEALANVLRLSGHERTMFKLAGTMGKLNSSPLSDAIQREILRDMPGAASSQTPQPPLAASILVFLIADVRGYTRFTQEHGDSEAARLASRFAGIARAATEQWEGRLIELRGDEALAVFASARKALLAALNMQARFAEATEADPDLPIYAGIGLDVGEAAPLEEGYRGAALNRAARLCSLAGAGEVLVSAGLAYLVPKVEHAAYVARGNLQLKGFDEPTGVLLLTQEPDEQPPLLLT